MISKWIVIKCSLFWAFVSWQKQNKKLKKQKSEKQASEWKRPARTEVTEGGSSLSRSNLSPFPRLSFVLTDWEFGKDKIQQPSPYVGTYFVVSDI